MARIEPISFERATGERANLYTGIRDLLGKVPNLYQSIAASTRALRTFLGISQGLRGGLFSNAEREAVALTVAELNGCDYCLAAHTTLGAMVRINPDEIIENRKAQSSDPKRNALLKLTAEFVRERGRVSDDTFKNFKAAGFTEAHIPELLLIVAENIYTNYFNNFNRTEIDFPKVKKI